MLVVRQNGQAYPVRLVHWWPGRWYKMWPNYSYWCGVRDHWTFPSCWRRDAETMGTRYMTVASVEMDGAPVVARAMCKPCDQPDRKAGRFIALLRLARALKGMGLRMERVP